MEFLAGVFAAMLLWPIFVFGTLWFWAFSACMFGWMIFLTEETESHGLAIFSVIAFVWLMSSANDVSVLVNPLLWLKWGIVYFVVGSAWSFLKWFSFLHKTKDKLKELKANFLKQYSHSYDDGYASRDKIELDADGKFTDQDFPLFAKYLNEHGYLSTGYRSDSIEERADVIPTVKGRYGDLVRWIIWWPISAFWTILNDPIRRIAQAIVRVFKGIYTKMALSVFGEEV